MTDITPGRVAYEARYRRNPESFGWDRLTPCLQSTWERVAQAVLNAEFLPAVAANAALARAREQVAAVTAERDALRQDVTELAEQWGIAAGADDCEFDHDLGDLGRAHAAALRKLTAERNAIEAYETRKAARS